MGFALASIKLKKPKLFTLLNVSIEKVFLDILPVYLLPFKSEFFLEDSHHEFSRKFCPTQNYYLGEGSNQWIIKVNDYIQPKKKRKKNWGKMQG